MVTVFLATALGAGLGLTLTIGIVAFVSIFAVVLVFSVVSVLGVLLVAAFSVLATAFSALLSALSTTAVVLLRLVELDVFRAFAATFRQWHLLYHFFQELLYLLEPVLVFLVYEGDGSTVTVGTGCTTDAVNVILCIVRNIVVDNHLDVIDVDSTSHDIGSHEYIILSALKLEHHVVALCLLQVGVHRTAVDAYLLKGCCQLLHLHLAAAEHDDTLHVASFEDFLDDGHLLGFIAYVSLLLDLLGWFAYGELNLYRVLEQGLSQFLNLLWHGGREHDGLAGLRQLACDGVDVLRETHVEHAVGLIKDEEAHLAQIHVTQRNVGDEAARGSDNYIGTHAEALQFLVVAVAVVAAIYSHAAHILQIVAEALHCLVYLLGQLAGW